MIKKIIKILKLVLEQIADVYLYFLGFYIICLILSLFFERWKLFFNWRVFHISVIVLGVLSLLSEKGRQFIFSQKKLFEFKRKQKFGFIKRMLKNLAASPFLKIKLKIKNLRKKDYLKFGAILIILVLALYKNVNPINFLVLTYALISILFVLESRIAAVIALLCLGSCPILLILKKEGIAETMAIYAYYFLVITVITQIREHWRDEKKKKVIHS